MEYSTNATTLKNGKEISELETEFHEVVGYGATPRRQRTLPTYGRFGRLSGDTI